VRKVEEFMKESGHQSDSNKGNFKNDPKRASEAGKKGGEHSHGGKSSSSSSEHSRGGTHEQHVKAGQQSHKNK
jgi:hypothetical protein